MEALVAVSAAGRGDLRHGQGDDRAMVIDAVRLVSKEGGRSRPDYHRTGEKPWATRGAPLHQLS